MRARSTGQVQERAAEASSGTVNPYTIRRRRSPKEVPITAFTPTQRAALIDVLAPRARVVRGAPSALGWLLVGVVAAIAPWTLLVALGLDVAWSGGVALAMTFAYLLARASTRARDRAVERAELAACPDAQLAVRYTSLCRLHSRADMPMRRDLDDLDANLLALVGAMALVER